MKKTVRTLITLTLSVVLVINMIPHNIHAEEDEIPAEQNPIVETVEQEEKQEEKVIEEETVTVQKEEAPVQEEIKREEKVEESQPEQVPAESSEKKEEIPAEEIKAEEVKKEEIVESVKVEETVEVKSAAKAAAAVEKTSFKVTLHFANILNADGSTKEMTESNTLTSGMGWNFTQKKLDNKITNKKVSTDEYIYEYTGEWKDAEGNPVSTPISISGKELTDDIDLYYYPVYSETKINHLSFRYIDNISTGSGSWRNQGSFTTYTHTYKQPANAAHYKFVYWLNTENNQTYQNKGKVSYSYPDTDKEVISYAYWQPSVTIVYHKDNGTTITSKEVYEDYALYSYKLTNQNGLTFEGWSYEIGGEVIDSSTVYSKLNYVNEKVAQTIYNVYAVYSTSYSVEHYVENLDGTYELKNTETVNDARIGSNAKAKVMEMEGFAVNSEKSLLEAAVKKGLVLKVYYSRKSFKVSYDYGTAPEGASALPAEKDYKFGASVKVAAPASAKGYTFSGWDSSDFNMPAQNVTIHGSWNVNSHKVTYTYDENAPENAPAVPQEKKYDFNAKVTIEKAPKMEGYTFSGWDKEDFVMGDEDVIITGVWKINSHKVTYIYDEAPENAPELPQEKEYNFDEIVNIENAPKMEGYTFSGWNKENFNMPDEDVIISGSWSINHYTVTWANEDGTVLELDEEVEFNAEPSYDGETPVKKADASFTYTFKGWTPEISPVTEDVTYTAEFTATPIPAAADEKNIPNDPEPEAPTPTKPAPTPEEPEQMPEEIAVVEEKIEEITIEEASVPTAEAETNLLSWALVNLICVIITILTALAMLISFIFKKNEENENEEEKAENEEEQQEYRRNKAKVLGIIPAVASVIIFILTEDMRNPMVLTDRYTILMIVIVILNLILAILSGNKKEREEEEEEKQNPILAEA